MSLENAYDRVDRMEKRDVLRMYEVGGKIPAVIKSMYEECMFSMRKCRKLEERLTWM
jgi:hypothetical protein